MTAVVMNSIAVAVIFLAAGTVRYWQGWALLSVGAACGLLSYRLLRKDPSLLERRLKFREGEASQRMIASLMYFIMGATVIVSAIDHRFRWSADIPLLAIAGDLIVAAGFYLYFLVFRENSYAGSTIEVFEGQKVISTGPYGIVRHPLYVALLITLIGMPLALGSYWGLLMLVPMIALIAWRLLDEERYLLKNLAGYSGYQSQIRWRLIPGVF